VGTHVHTQLMLTHDKGATAVACAAIDGVTMQFPSMVRWRAWAKHRCREVDGAWGDDDDGHDDDDDDDDHDDDDYDDDADDDADADADDDADADGDNDDDDDDDDDDADYASGGGGDHSRR
jgi:hypothetical protein